jgi:succinate dehydrogenase flavin-adding protein (antitoxin of CptAB toxin-antitoxin module)
MDTNNMFEFAARQKIRFASNRGMLSVEQLFDTPLRSKDGFDLNEIAKGINQGLKAAQEENFVDQKRNTAQDRAELSFEIVKHVIQTKVAEEKAAEQAATNRAEKAKLLDLLAQKQDEKLGSLSEKEIQKRIQALEA